MAGLLDANSLEFSIMPFLFCHMTIFYTLYNIMRSVVGLHFQLTLKKMDEKGSSSSDQFRTSENKNGARLPHHAITLLTLSQLSP